MTRYRKTCHPHGVVDTDRYRELSFAPQKNVATYVDGRASVLMERAMIHGDPNRVPGDMNA